MRLVFLGTGNFACGCLDGLKRAGITVDLVVTMPDRRRGRGGNFSAPPAKQWALENGLSYVQPPRINNCQGRELIAAAGPDLMLVVEYGRILNPALLAIPPLGAVNVHASLLPALRGAAPIEWAILKGFDRTGVSTIFIDQGMDTGDIILQRSMEIQPGENSGQLRKRLTALAGDLLPETVRMVFAGNAPRIPQPETGVSYAPRLTSDMEKICWQESSGDIANRVRAFAPSPGAYCMFRGKRVKILAARARAGTLLPAVLKVDAQRLLVGCGKGLLEILELKPEGKRTISAAQFINGYRVQEGEQFR